MDQLGEVIGKAIAAKPETKVIEPKVTVDAKPIARAVTEASKQNAQAITDAINLLIAGVGEKIGQGVTTIADGQHKPADLTGIEGGLELLADALTTDTVVTGLGDVVAALQIQAEAIAAQSTVLEAQERAILDQTRAIEENTAAIRADRSVDYDGEGRITRMSVAS